MRNIINDFAGKKVLIVGDVMLDAYIIGKVDRVSPEAPVPIVNIGSLENRLGGAANVALNIAALNAIPVLCSVIGNDKDGLVFLDILKQRGMETQNIILSNDRSTTTKTRVLGNNHHLLRLDKEDLHDLNEMDNNLLLQRYKQVLPNCDVVILQDYNKGVLTENNIETLINLAKKLGKPIAVDPKKKNFLRYKGVTLFKPNLKEIKEGLNTDANLKDKEQLKKEVLKLNVFLQNELTMVTLSEDGVMISDHKNFDFIPAHLRNISDVSGAGDTVISVASLCLALGEPPKTIAAISNLAGGLVCEETGVMPIDIEKLNNEFDLIYKNSEY